jgi:hypothetical protein
MCCLEVECRKASCVINGQSVKSGTKEYYVELPKLVGGIGWADIKFLGLDDYKTNFVRKNLLGFNTSDGDYWGRNNALFTIIGKEAKLKNLPTAGLRYVCLIGILDDPTTACTWDADIEYPLPNHLIAKLEIIVLKQILSTYNIKGDYRSDALPGNTLQNIPQQPQDNRRDNNDNQE